jgi:hypothetical protein
VISLGILSWGSPLTLQNTLESYEYWGLLNYANERLIFFQEISDRDIRIADAFGFQYSGAVTNVGIAEGYRRLVSQATSENFLFLENDWKLLRNPTQQLTHAEDLLDEGLVDIVRLRDRYNPGDPLWTRQFEGNELSRPEHLLDSIHWTDPSKFSEISHLYDLYITSARYANWTNNPTIAQTQWLIDNILPRLDGDIERHLQGWWQEQDFVVAQGEGLFTHNRRDR